MRCRALRIAQQPQLLSVFSLSPTERLCLFFDGPAPHAKMILSRKKAARANRPDFDVGRLSKLNLTTGSELMEWIVARVQAFPLPKGLALHVSSAAEPGEAELKLIAWLVRHRRRDGHKRIVIVGDDYDLVVLALCALDYSDIAVLRSQAYIPLTAVLEQLQDWTGPQHRLPVAHHPMRLELSMVTLLTGNDYFPALNIGTPVLWRCACAPLHREAAAGAKRGREGVPGTLSGDPDHSQYHALPQNRTPLGTAFFSPSGPEHASA